MQPDLGAGNNLQSIQYQFSRSVVFDYLRPHESQHTRPPSPSPTPGVHANTCASSRWCHPTISSVVPFSSSLQPYQHQGLLQKVSSLHQVAEVLEFELQHQSFQWIFRTNFLYNGLVGSPCSPRDSQESSPTPQFKSINSPVLSFLYSPILTSIDAVAKSLLSCLTLCGPIDSSPPVYPVHGIYQARTLEWVAISFSRGTVQSRNQTGVSCIAGRCFTSWTEEKWGIWKNMK